MKHTKPESPPRLVKTHTTTKGLRILDTDTCSYILRRRPLSVKTQFEKVGSENLAISAVTLAELYYGAARHPDSARIRREIEDLAARLKVLAWDDGAADHYCGLRAGLEKAGTPIGAMDMMIAAHALSLGAVLVTNNLQHFERVPGLRLENWS